MKGLALCLLAFAVSGLTHQDDVPVFPKHTTALAENNWIETRIKLTPEDGTTKILECINACRGKKHLLHTECDTSCDAACTETHKYEFLPELTCRPGGDLKQGAGKFGLTDPTWTIVPEVYKEARAEFKDKAKQFTIRHWNQEPCSTSTKVQHFKVYKMQVDYQFFRNDEGPGGRKVLVKGPSGTWDLGKATVPDGDPQPGNTIVKCRCSVVGGSTPTDEHGGVYIEKEGKPEFATSKIIEDTGITVECTSMNECVVSCSNQTGNQVNVSVGCGTVLECEDGSCQDEVLCEDVKFMCAPFSRAEESARAGPHLAELSGKGRAACLNMHKMEPRAGIKYRIAMPTSNSLTQLAKLSSQEAIQGPWGQIRLWILTDHASIDDIGKILIPKPTPSVYMRALFDVANTTHCDLAASEFNECVHPSLVVGGSVTQAMTNWFVDFWARKDAKVFAAWLNAHTNELADACLGPNATNLQIAHVADLCNALCASGSPEMMGAALTVLQAVPETRRGDVAKAHGLSGAMGLLNSKDGTLAEQTLTLAMLYRDQESMPGLLNVEPSLGADLKDRAAKLYKELGGK